MSTPTHLTLTWHCVFSVKLTCVLHFLIRKIKLDVRFSCEHIKFYVRFWPIWRSFGIVASLATNSAASFAPRQVVHCLLPDSTAFWGTGN